MRRKDVGTKRRRLSGFPFQKWGGVSQGGVSQMGLSDGWEPEEVHRPFCVENLYSKEVSKEMCQVW